MDQKLRDFYVQNPEQNIFLQGRVLFFGAEPFVISYERRARAEGRSRTSLARNLKYFIDGIAGYSYLPVRLMSLAGLLLFSLSILASVIIAVYVLRYGSHVEGWASLIIVMLGLQGLQMLFMGVIGEYLWRTLDEVRRRPHYLVESVQE
jgi:dolichol-phosphate mannosyltransferase